MASVDSNETKRKLDQGKNGAYNNDSFHECIGCQGRRFQTKWRVKETEHTTHRQSYIVLLESSLQKGRLALHWASFKG